MGRSGPTPTIHVTSIGPAPADASACAARSHEPAPSRIASRARMERIDVTCMNDMRPARDSTGDAAAHVHQSAITLNVDIVIADAPVNQPNSIMKRLILLVLPL